MNVLHVNYWGTRGWMGQNIGDLKPLEPNKVSAYTQLCYRLWQVLAVIIANILLVTSVCGVL